MTQFYVKFSFFLFVSLRNITSNYVRLRHITLFSPKITKFDENLTSFDKN
jgi:hypothetical protein